MPQRCSTTALNSAMSLQFYSKQLAVGGGVSYSTRDVPTSEVQRTQDDVTIGKCKCGELGSIDPDLGL